MAGVTFKLRALKKARATHCCDILDSGRALGFNFIIMTLVGASLMTAGLLFLNFLKDNMSSTDVCYKPKNFLHRDLKPANFCICVDDVRRIYLLDFGMCRRYIDSDNAVRRPRWASGFRGTQR
ncbi:hypothetical protein ANCCEY_11300 [Ancylostoma ceylanicum]|uniref:non-specific serine/threonine protein kinase n=1 Tax=Ancylostoma ceylanicum TaxID=53326 RepID=A0A0D6LEH3_9BILA|nr:hypothetical protein ANCCEY_11300 [Ancylostoma ceylanicum]